MPPIGVLSVMVNAVCNLRCLHCGLPRQFERYPEALSPVEWERLVNRASVLLSPKVLTVAAMEPLLPRDQEKTATILHTALDRGMTAGLVTNGMFLEQFHRRWPELRPSFLDISVEGSRDIDQHMRGQDHFDLVEEVLRSGTAESMTDRLYISCCVTDLNAPRLDEFLDWIRAHVSTPRVVLIALDINKNVDSSVHLSEESLRRAIDIATAKRGMEEVILDLFPAAPSLNKLRTEGVLPRAGECQPDQNGTECGWVTGNVFVRFQNLQKLALHQLRISPEGCVLAPTGYGHADYLKYSLGSLLNDEWSGIEEGIIKDATLL